MGDSFWRQPLRLGANEFGQSSRIKAAEREYHVLRIGQRQPRRLTCRKADDNTIGVGRRPLL
jgi:hypothetical protein